MRVKSRPLVVQSLVSLTKRRERKPKPGSDARGRRRQPTLTPMKGTDVRLLRGAQGVRGRKGPGGRGRGSCVTVRPAHSTGSPEPRRAPPPAAIFHRTIMTRRCDLVLAQRCAEATIKGAAGEAGGVGRRL
ncbi:hypothetical protein E2C01_025474 [Portunus trituberculatus]|uniref:Uncharacterized protein n=1 Tax=Portunus trituberculatus TaxID=210409 RepID=A0A5B7EG07_PORTR|nr:hypothetical protein [Portunus trituberculatus]